MNFMVNQMNKLQKNRKNKNKGFTLVELIIVIAIIAVLAAVLAPQYIKYVERSRAATDANTVSEIAHAGEVASLGDGSTGDGSGTVKIAISSAGVLSYTGGTLDSEVVKIVPADQYTFKSKTYKGQALTITMTNGKAAWTAPTTVE